MRGIENPPVEKTQEVEKRKFRVAIVDNSDQVESASRDAADKNLSKSKEELAGVKGFFKKIWTHNIAKPYYQQKEIAKAKANILESGNVHVNDGGEIEHHKKECLAITERFLSEFEKETVHREAGESRDVLGKNEGEQAIQSKIKDLVMEYANEKMTEEAFAEEKIRIFSELKGARKDVIDKGLMYSDNVLEIAKQVKQAVEHGERLTAHDLDFEVVIGRAKSGVRTEAQYSSVDKLTAKIMDSKVGCLVNETTVASALAIAYSLGATASKSFANSKLAAWTTFGATAVLGGGIAAARERKMMEDDRKQHFREMAQGKKFEDSKAPRRKEMEQYRYETRDADSLFQNLDQSMYAHDKDGKQELKQDLSFAEFQVAFGQLAEIESRINLSDGKKIDLVSYSDVKNVEQERLMLDIARAKAKVDLRKCADSPAMKKVLNGKSVDEFLSSLTETRSKQLIQGEKGIEHQNELFKECKTKATAKAFVKGVVTGLVVGAAAQELLSFINPNQTGMLENFFMRDAHGAVDANGAVIPEHYTPLEYVRRWVSEKMGGNEFPRMDMQNAHEEIVGAMHVKLPEGVNLEENANGSFSLMRGEEILNNNITLDDAGNISQHSKFLLHEHGIEIKSGLGQGTPQEYIQHNPDSTTHVRRDLWYENDTPAPVFDKNELGLRWGGHEGTGIDADGNYVFNVKHMTPDGSYQGDFSVDAQEAMKSGELKMIFSLSKDSQNHVFEVPIDAHGNAIIDPNSEAGKILFEDVDGHAKFLGKYAEVAQDMGEGSDGADHVRILATHVGKGIDQFGSPIAIFDVPAPYEVDAPWLIPAIGRMPLEPISHAPSPEYGPYSERGNDSKQKQNYTEVYSYRNYMGILQKLIDEKKLDENFKKKYEILLKRLHDVDNFAGLPEEQREKYKDEAMRSNNRYERGDSVEDYVESVRDKMCLQLGNALLEEAKVGEKPFPLEFYKNSPLVKGLENANEVVVILDNPIGDAVLSVPIIMAVNEFYKQNGQKKKITVASSTPGLFKNLEHQFEGIVTVMDLNKELPGHLAKSSSNDKFFINAHKQGGNAKAFGLTESEFRDLSRMMSVDYGSWMKEEVLMPNGKTKKYDPLPARIMRNFENMLGQKLFADINAMDHFIERDHDFDKKSQVLKAKYGVSDNERIVVAVPGSSVMPKEYTPERWKEIFKDLFTEYPDTHVLFMENTDPIKRERYGKMVDEVVAQNGYKISRVSEKLDQMNTIMSMADLSITTDTGLGHLCGAVGTPNVMLIMGNPVKWSTAKTIRVNHPKAIANYKAQDWSGVYGKAWEKPNDYFVDDNGEKVGASDIDPKRVIEQVKKVFKNIDALKATA